MSGVSNREEDVLSARKKLILKAIVDAHIYSGEPVGSKYLTQNEQITLSSATLRNEMSELEELGYLEQPHTSAGRIPSERGYRFYVNSLMESYRLTSGELKALGGVASVKAAQIDRLLEQAARVMSAFTRYTALAVKAKPKQIVVSRYKTIFMDEKNFLLVMIMNTDLIKTRQISVTGEMKLDEDGLGSVEAVLNVYLTGIQMDAVTLPMIMEMESRLRDGYEALLQSIIKCVYEVLNELDSGELMLEGMNHFLEYPEYADVDRLRSILTLLEKKEDILNIVSDSEKDVTNVYIGSENRMEIMRESTLIFKTISSGDRMVGAIGIIGPCRMDYSRMITAVETMARNIGGMMKGSAAIGDGSRSGDEKTDEKEKENHS